MEEQIRAWVAAVRVSWPLSIVKIEELLARQGCRVPYRTLHRFAFGAVRVPSQESHGAGR